MERVFLIESYYMEDAIFQCFLGRNFAHLLLHRQSATRRTSRRSVLFLKGNNNVSSCSKSFGLRRDCRRGRLVNSCDVEKFVMASLPEIESIDSITDKLPNQMNNVKIKISEVKKCTNTQKTAKK